MKKELSGLLLCGLAIGWLSGLAASPVIQSVLTALLAAIVGLAAVLSGLKDQRFSKQRGEPEDRAESEGGKWTKSGDPMRLRLRAGPLVALVLGVALGAPVGLYGRLHGWFAQPLEVRWEGTGLARETIYRRAFEKSYELDPGDGTKSSPAVSEAKGLLGTEAVHRTALEALDEFKERREKKPDKLDEHRRRFLSAIASSESQAIAGLVDLDVGAIEFVLENFVCRE